ncbi:diaminopimelate decarboxylase [Planktothricoides sp. SR001]|uniref:alanine racemase n=1 Tax=Planktothricoides sp. SR001 TaxID=1705388 RepID=UPI0006BF9B2B|nr:alanine racemase [Planktothricoides sp. SR001]KOR36849.1 diaminopimelate decarboxylase [Planktothricoides sp. SR001]
MDYTIKTKIAGVNVEDLVTKFGSPLFVYSEATLRKQFRSFKNAFTTRYPKVTFGWSYKTNYLKAICAIFHQEGAIAELVSKMEYEKAKNLGIPGEDIILNGPHKPYDTLLEAIKDEGTVNIDHFEEIQDLEKIASILDKTLTVGIRINLDTGIEPCWSRFGFNLESGEAMEAVQHIAKSNRLRLNGLHSHIGTFITNKEAYDQQVEKMVKFGYEIEDHFGWQMEYIDIGGGFASNNKIKEIYHVSKGAIHSNEGRVPSIDDYAETICNALLKSLRPNHRPKLIIESGRLLVDEAGTLITTVCGTKRLPDGNPGYVIDAGINLLFLGLWFDFNIALAQAIPGQCENSQLYGPLCTNIDVIAEAISLPPLSRGDRLVISNIGAYNNSFWFQFIEYRPNIVLITERGDVELIRAAEDLSDIERREYLPSRLELIQPIKPVH